MSAGTSKNRAEASRVVLASVDPVIPRPRVLPEFEGLASIAVPELGVAAVTGLPQFQAAMREQNKVSSRLQEQSAGLTGLLLGATEGLQRVEAAAQAESTGIGIAGRPARPRKQTRTRNTSQPLSAAVRVAVRARTRREFGHALKQLRESAGLSLRALENKLAEEERWIRKSTLSRACSGESVFGSERHLVAFVTACGAAHELCEWISAWRQARNFPVMPTAAARDVTAVHAAMDADSDNDLDAVICEVTVQVTHRHLQLARARMTATNTRGPAATEQTADAALDMATGLALLEHGQPMLAQADVRTAS